MTKLQEQNEDRALDRWARSEGYADFETYVRIGGSLADARRSLRHRIEMAQWALAAINRMAPMVYDKPTPADQIEIGPEALARAEAEQLGDPVDASNIPAQGFER